MANQPEHVENRAHLLTLSEVKEILVREQSSREELSYEQKLALDHADHFVKLTPEKAKELAEKLLAIGGRINEYYAYRFADLLPTHGDDVKAVFARERSAPDEAEIEKVLAAVRDYI